MQRARRTPQWLLSFLAALFALAVAAPPTWAETDVTARSQVIRTSLLYDRATGTSYLDVSLKNTSAVPLIFPAQLVIPTVTPATITVSNADGTTADGKPYLQFTRPSNLLNPGETTAVKRLKFRNPAAARFAFSVAVRATVPDATGQVGAAGGVIGDAFGVQAIFPAGALDAEQMIAVTAVPLEMLNLVSAGTPGVTVLGAVRLTLGQTVLKDNADLAIPRPSSLGTSGSLRVGRVFPLGDRSGLLAVDTAILDGERIVSQDPGAINTDGTYVFVEVQSPCSVTFNPAWWDQYAPGRTPTCGDQLAVSTYLRVAWLPPTGALLKARARAEAAKAGSLSLYDNVSFVTDFVGHYADAAFLAPELINPTMSAGDFAVTVLPILHDYLLTMGVYGDSETWGEVLQV